MQRQTLLFGSIYTFHDVQDLFDKLRATREAENLVCTFDRAKQLCAIVNNKDPEVAALALSKALLLYTETSLSDDDDDDDEAVKVSLISDVQHRRELDALYDEVDRLVRLESDESISREDALLITHEGAKMTWELSSKSHEAMYSHAFIRAFENATGGRLERGEDGAISLYADSQDILEKIRVKLLACEKTYVSRANGEFEFDFHIDENETGHHFRFRLPTSTSDHRFYSVPRFFNRFYELVMVRWDASSQQYISLKPNADPIVPFDRSLLWSPFFEFEFGDRETIAKVLKKEDHFRLGRTLRRLAETGANTVANKDAQIDTWVEEVTNDPEPPSTSITELKPTSLKEKLNQWREFASNPGTHRLDAGDFRKKSEGEGFLEPTTLKSMRARRRSFAQLDEVVEENENLPVPHLVGPGVVQGGPRPTSVNGDARINTKAPIEQLYSDALQPGFSTGVRAKTSTSIHSYLAPATFNEKKPKLTGRNDLTFMRTHQASTLPPSHDPRDLTTGESLFGGRLYDTRQSAGLRVRGPPGKSTRRDADTKSETIAWSSVKGSDREHRRYHRQGSQRAPPRGGTKSKPFELNSEVWKVLFVIIDSAKLNPNASMMLTLEFGKIFIDGETVPEIWRCPKSRPAHAFKPENWSEIFHARRERSSATTKFSPRITDNWYEAEHVIELQNERGESIFTSLQEDALPNQETRIVVHCADNRSGTQVILRLGDSKQLSMFRPRSRIGSVNLHFPKRSWDARFLAEEEVLLEPNLELSFREIVEDLWVSGPKEHQDFTKPVVASSKGPFVDIKGVEIHRDVVYVVKEEGFKGLSLILTQVQSLQIDDGSTSFSAYLRPEEEMRQSGQIWWLMSLRSACISTHLRRYEELDFGDNGGFGECAEIEHECKSMVTLAKELVPRMDRVGVNGAFHRPSRSLSSSPRKRSLPSHAARSTAVSYRGGSRENSRIL